MNHSFSVEVAEKFGIEKAVILENFYFWIRKNKANKKNIHDGRCYTYNTAEAFAELFPYIKERKIAQLLREMENEDNLLISGQFFNYDRTKSYTLTDFALSFFEHSNIQEFDNGTSKKCIIENQDSGDCLNTDINTVINPNIKADEPPAPVYIQKTFNASKSDYKNLMDIMFSLITEHNKKSRHKVPIQKDLFYFEQKEGSNILQLLKQYETTEIKTALENYLKVANSDTWKSGFSFGAFCKNISEYTPEFFDMTKYVNIPKTEEELIMVTEPFAEKHETDKWFDYAIFHHHRADWIKAGKPEGESFEKWADEVYEEDRQNGKLDSDGCYI